MSPATGNETGNSDVAVQESDNLPEYVDTNMQLRVFSDDDLRAMSTFEDAWSALESEAGAVEDFADYGTGFELLKKEEKGQLVGRPFVILEWRFNPGDFGGEFVSFAAMTKDNRKVIVNDGGTGIAKQLRSVTDERLKKGHSKPQMGLIIKAGLSDSAYWYREEDGDISRIAKPGYIPAHTYYLADK